jgi:DNA-binding helix-hairpin-helix protein with protein kinase domain
MPKLISGNFASVFTVRSSTGQQWAVKCFTRLVDHQEERYQRISEALRPVKKSWRVEFDYLTEGVMCEGHWYPIVKMEWVDAVELIPFIEKHLWDSPKLADLATKFARMVEDLATLGIAHGDLQHGNLLVTSSGELKLIDYDGMYVPSLARMGACEVGHANYQSPARTSSSWGPHLDNFSAWVIYASLVALTIEPSLWTLLRNQGDEALLFKKDDFDDQRASRAFQVLSQSRVLDLQALGTGMKALWAPDVRNVPPLDPSMLPTPSRNSTAANSPQPTPLSSVNATLSVPDWVTQIQATRQAGPQPLQTGTAWIAGHLPPLPVVEFQPSRVILRVIAGLTISAIVSIGILAGLRLVPIPMVGLATGISALLFIAVSLASFRSTSEWRNRHAKLVILKNHKADASDKTREVSRLDHSRRDIDGREQKEIGRIAKQAEKAKSSEQKEISEASKRLQAQVGNLEKQRQRLAASETSETGEALRSLQDNHVARYLGNQLINSAGIPGIGPTVARSLAMSGIRSAADFAGIQYQTGPRGGQQICIRTRYGLIHPNGIGEKKARDLERWRMSIERHARMTQPNALPPPQLQAIRMKYTQQRQALADQEQAARAQSVHELGEIRLRWAAIHGGFSSDLTATHQKFAQERAQADAKLGAVQKMADAALWHRELAEREVAAYQKVSYRRYLAGITRP